MSRPLVYTQLPVWASGGPNYPAGANPWNGTPIIVDPGAGAVAAGYSPNLPPGAQYDNYYQNLLAQFLGYLDQIDAFNFINATQAFPVTYNQPSTFERICDFDFTRGRYWLVGSSGITAGQVFFSDNGLDWTNDTSNLPGTNPLYTMCAVDGGTSVVVIGTNTDSKMTFRNPAGTWAHFNLTTASAFADPARWVEHDGTLSDFLVAGSVTIPLSATFPAIFKLHEGGSPIGTTLTPSLLTIDNPGGIAHGFFKWVCCRPTNTIGVAMRIAIASLTAPAAQFTTWTNSNLASDWEPAQGSSILADPFTTPVALACSERDGVFMVTCSDGKVFTSTDGNWTLRSTDADAFQPNCLASRGSVWLAVAQSTAGTNYLKLSIDNGATWTRIAWPFAQNVTPMGINPSSGQRFEVSGAHGGAVFSSQSLRTR